MWWPTVNVRMFGWMISELLTPSTINDEQDQPVVNSKILQKSWQTNKINLFNEQYYY